VDLWEGIRLVVSVAIPLYYNTKKDSQLIKLMDLWQGIRLVVSVVIPNS
jgi:hypothetical protein